MTTLLRVEGADVRYGSVMALRGVNLQVQAGERVALVGANGSGKSTLLRLLHGLAAPSRGALHVQGAARQAMVFQRPFVLRASARNNVALATWLRGGVSWRAACVQAMAALERVELGVVAHRQARALSSGQQQRLALARAWSVQPDLLFMDEPTSSLDPHAKREVEALIAGFADSGLTMVFASHNLGQVKRLASRVVYLEQGRVLADLPVSQFFDQTLLRAVSPHADLFIKGEIP